MEEAQVFNPYDPEYCPRISNGKIEEIAAEIEQLGLELAAAREELKRDNEATLAAAERTIEYVDTTVSTFNEYASHIALVLREDLRKEAREQVAEAIAEAKDEDNAGRPE